MKKIICGFPGIGKSYLVNKSLSDEFFKKHEFNNKTVSDSDSSSFSWIKTGVRNPEFPQNYINAIKERTEDIILVSSHKIVRDALLESGIKFIVVYPEIKSKVAYLKRYRRRGSSDEFISLMNANWEKWINEIKEDSRLLKYELRTCSTLATEFKSIESLLDNY